MEIQLVKMCLADPAGIDAQKIADIHPAEVQNMLQHGWRVVEAQPQSDPEPETTPTAELPATPKLKRNK
jgi:hypothetical protein